MMTIMSCNDRPRFASPQCHDLVLRRREFVGEPDPGGRSDSHHCECDCGVLVSRSEFEPFQGRENGSNSNLDANIECGGCATETVGGRKGDAITGVTAETAQTAEPSCCAQFLKDETFLAGAKRSPQMLRLTRSMTFSLVNAS